MNFDLKRMVRAMAGLGNPQNRFPSIHVAGTNGKGSVSAMLASVLQATGLRVGMYTSPHLERVNERFQINGRMISDKDLNRLAHSVHKKYRHLTQFEFLTAVAFLWFAEKKIDVAVVETGLGGRLDATNVLRRLWASVITNIDLDHTHWLGSSKRKIAAEKAGIIKPRVPVVTGAQGTALTVIQMVAKKKRAPVTVAPEKVFHYYLSLQGTHQKNNASVVVETARLLSERGLCKISEKEIRQGLATAKWPGRFEEIRPGVILDGAHNPAGCRVLVRSLKERKLVPADFLFGALRDKDIHEMAKVLSKVAGRCVTVPVPSDRSASAEELANLPAWRRKAFAADSILDGWEMLSGSVGHRPLVIAGSLYLVGDMRRRLK